MKLSVRSGKLGWNERGSTLVEAAVALPLFLIFLLVSLNLLHFCFQIVRFQYDVSETMRETFTRARVSRTGQNWEAYFKTQLRARSQDIFPQFEDSMVSAPTFSDCPDSTGWGCAATASPGTIVSLKVEVPNSFNLLFLDDIPALKDLKVKTKAVAVVQMRQTE